MNAIRLVSVLAALVLQNAASLAQNAVPNGDFESDFAGWTPVGSAQISGAVAQSGAKSLLASDTGRALYSYAYQQLALDYDQHEISFWVNPVSETYYSAFELIADWQSGPAVFITRVLLRDSALGLTAVDQSLSVPNTLTVNSWNNITIRVDKSNLKQDFFVNDTLAGSLTASSFPTIEHLLVGDLSVAGMYGTVYFDAISIVNSPSTDIAAPAALPDDYVLEQNFPNPFNPSTRISYHLPAAADVHLAIYSIKGRKVRTLVRTRQPAGRQSVGWNGLDDRGHPVAAGLYLLSLRTQESRATRKMLFLK